MCFGKALRGITCVPLLLLESLVINMAEKLRPTTFSFLLLIIWQIYEIYKCLQGTRHCAVCVNKRKSNTYGACPHRALSQRERLINKQCDKWKKHREERETY